MTVSEADVYKKLYYHAFNRYTQLLEYVTQVQQELEELYLLLGECDEKEIDQVLYGQNPFDTDCQKSIFSSDPENL